MAGSARRTTETDFMDIVERLRKHALPDPHDEREVLHAPLLREAAAEIEALRRKLAVIWNALIEPPNVEFSGQAAASSPRSSAGTQGYASGGGEE